MRKARKTGWIYFEDYDPEIHGTDFVESRISLSVKDSNEVRGSGPYGVVAINPQSKFDRWYIARKHFDDNYEEFIE